MLDVTRDVPTVAGFGNVMFAIHKEVHMAGDQIASLLVRVLVWRDDRTFFHPDFS